MKNEMCRELRGTLPFALPDTYQLSSEIHEIPGMHWIASEYLKL